jgi:hypothetical protein
MSSNIASSTPDSGGGKTASTNSATSGQPQMGQPNQNVPAPYTNTVSQWDNGQAPTMPSNPTSGNSVNSPIQGKGKG